MTVKGQPRGTRGEKRSKKNENWKGKTQVYPWLPTSLCGKRGWFQTPTDEIYHSNHVSALESRTPQASCFWKRTRILRSKYAGGFLVNSLHHSKDRNLFGRARINKYLDSRSPVGWRVFAVERAIPILVKLQYSRKVWKRKAKRQKIREYH